LKGEKPSAKFCLLDNKEKGFCIVSSLGMKNGFILIANVEKSFATPPILNIDAKAEYPWKEGNALYLVGSEGYNVP